MGRNLGHIDWIATLLLLAVGSFGLFVLLTIHSSFFGSQLAYMIFGFVLLFIFATLDPLLVWYAAPASYVAACIFLALSYLGPSIRGATRWIVIGSAQLQPSELAKPFFLLAFSYALAKYPPRKLQFFPLHLVLFLIPFLLIFKQPDLGTSIVYGAFWLAMLVAGGLPLRALFVGILTVVLLLPIGWKVLAPYQQSRIATFINPTLDPQGAGYNALQAMISVGSGQLFGRGLGRGTQSHLRFLPEHHTDFIFATLIEELGFVGGILLLMVYGFLLSRILLPLVRARTDAGVFTYCVGLFAMLLSQIFINTGMNMGLIPITGITLPFVSYGGSSILSTAIAFGLLFGLKRGLAESAAVAIG